MVNPFMKSQQHDPISSEQSSRWCPVLQYRSLWRTFYIQTDIQRELKLVSVVQCLPDQQGIKSKVQKPRHGQAKWPNW